MEPDKATGRGGASKTWSGTPRFYNSRDDSNPGDFHTLTYEVAALADVSVPAGVFASAHIVAVLPAAFARDGVAHDMSGRRLPDGATREDGRWLAAGVGKVKEMAWEPDGFIDPLPGPPHPTTKASTSISPRAKRSSDREAMISSASPVRMWRAMRRAATGASMKP